MIAFDTTLEAKEGEGGREKGEEGMEVELE